jgi:hypothetical protein
MTDRPTEPALSASPAEQRRALRALFAGARQFGFVRPVVARREDRTVTGGLLRHLAAWRLGLPPANTYGLVGRSTPIPWLGDRGHRRRVIGVSCYAIGDRPTACRSGAPAVGAVHGPPELRPLTMDLSHVESPRARKPTAMEPASLEDEILEYRARVDVVAMIKGLAIADVALGPVISPVSRFYPALRTPDSRSCHRGTTRKRDELPGVTAHSRTNRVLRVTAWNCCVDCGNGAASAGL